MEQQSALEWLQSGLELIMSHEEQMQAIGLFEQAKKMEKDQHQETWELAHQAGRFEGEGICEKNWQTFETHWEKTFKTK